MFRAIGMAPENTTARSTSIHLLSLEQHYVSRPGDQTVSNRNSFLAPPTLTLQSGDCYALDKCPLSKEEKHKNRHNDQGANSHHIGHSVL